MDIGDEVNKLTVEFLFDTDEKVETPFGEGIIDMCAIGNARDKMYFVKQANGSEWFPERLLKAKK